MKPVHVLTAATLASLVGWAGLTSWRVPRAMLEREVGAQILGLSGMKVSSDAIARFTALPVPRVSVTDVRLRDAKGALSLNAAGLSGRLRILPLAGGRFELADITLLRPTLTVSPASVAAGALAPFGRLLSAYAAQEGGPELPELRRLTIVDGALVAAGPGDEPRTLLSSVTGTVSRGAARDTLDATASMTWRGEAVSLSAEGLRPTATPGLDPSPIRVSARSAAGTLDLTGVLAGGGSRQFDGRIAASTDSATRLAAWLDVTPPIPLTGGLSLSGDIRILPGSVSLANASVSHAVGRFDGALTLREDETGRTEIGGTLATDRMDLTPALRALAGWRAPDGAWSREPLDPAALPAGDIDLRVSAASVTAGATTLSNAALAIRGRGGRTDVVVGNADLLDGRLKGRVSLAAAPGGGVDVRVQGSLERFDMGSALAAIGSARRMTGAGQLTLQVDASGDTPMALMRALDGKANLVVRQGDLVGVNIADLLARIEKKPLAAALEIRGGRTPFETAVLSGRISRGAMEITEGAVVSPEMRVSFGGQIGLAERSYALSGEAFANASAADTARPAFALPFEVTGALESPVITPDARSLIRRSGAAAPFFAPIPSQAASSPPALAGARP